MIGEFCHHTREAIINRFNLVNSFNHTSFIGQLFRRSHCIGSVGSCIDDPISISEEFSVVELRRQMCTGICALPESGILVSRKRY